MRYLFLMSLSGSFLFAGYLAWERLCGNKLTQCMRYRALVMVLLAYVVPWVWVREVYNTILMGFRSRKTVIIGEMPVSYADISTKEEAFRTQNYWLLLTIVGIWVVVTAILLFRKCREYLSDRKEFLEKAEDCRNSNPEKVAIRLQKELHCLRRPKIYVSEKVGSAFTIGVISPVIFLPKDYADMDLELILRHEMIHIARGDLLVKLLMELACCLHWFNPLVRRLNDRLDMASETSCDERVVKGCTKEERAVYAKLIVRIMRNSGKKTMLGSALENNYEVALERVNLIMKTNKIGMFGKLAATFVFALFLFTDSLTAFAYPKVLKVNSEVGIDNVHDKGNYSMKENSGLIVPTDIVLYDEQIIDMDGNILPVDGASTYGVICVIRGHQDGPCYFQSHHEDDNGGCTVKVYNARYCPICNNVWVDSWYATYTYAVCTH